MVCILSKFNNSDCYDDKIKQINSLDFQKRYFESKTAPNIRYWAKHALFATKSVSIYSISCPGV